MRILVTGAAGWLGRHLIPMLRARGDTPYGVDVCDSPWTDRTISVADRGAIEALFDSQKIDAVIHAAALHKPDIARLPQQAFVDVNVTGTLNLLEIAAARPGTNVVFTSTTSLMISQQIREERSDRAVWLDETAGPLEPRNIYGVTKLAAEGLCRQHHLERGLNVIILRTARFFPEEDDTLSDLTGSNLKANELLYRRATVEDMARAHLAALDGAERVGFGLYVVSAPTPFGREDLGALKTDAASVIGRYYPDAEEIYAAKGWHLPPSIGRVYDGSQITQKLGFEYDTTFADVLTAIKDGTALPVQHDPNYTSPMVP